MTFIETTKSEIKSWLETIFKSEDLQNLELTILGNSGKGDGYMGDIVFTEVSGIGKNKERKKFNLVLKCSKSSQKLRESSPVKEAFLSEIYFYEVVFPTFLQFQKERNVDEPFAKVPKCYGTLSTGKMEIVALEDLKTKGYILWERTNPLTRDHIDMVVKEYAKLHAVSIAMKDQEPEKFKNLVDGLDNVLKRFSRTTGMLDGFEESVEELHDLLLDDLNENILKEWLLLKSKVRPFFDTIFDNLEGLKVITHGDCWNNNFMHYHIDNEPSDFVILDWQLITYSSPICDLSYFLFTCLSKEDMDDIYAILHHYYKNLEDHLKKLGSDLNYFYPEKQFLDEWKKYSKFGILLSTVIHKFSVSENEDVPDMTEAAEKGEDVAKTFSKPIKNTEDYRKRMRYIVNSAIKNGLI